METADVILIINEGSIEQIGTPEEICRKPETEFVADFIAAERFEALKEIRGLRRLDITQL